MQIARRLLFYVSNAYLDYLLAKLVVSNIFLEICGNTIKFSKLLYSDLPNNCAANLIVFRRKNTYTTLLGPTCLLISEIFPSKPDFHLHK